MAASESLLESWPAVRSVWKRSFAGVFATVASDGTPRVTPVGSVWLHPTEPRGYYHPRFVAGLPKNLAATGRFQLLFLDTSPLSWLKPLVVGRFDQLVAARLSGCVVGERREARGEECNRFRRRVRAVSWTRGHALLWQDMAHVQELSFDDVLPIRFGRMPHRAV